MYYCNGEEARNTFINTYNWIIEGDYKKCLPDPVTALEEPHNYAVPVYPNPVINDILLQFEIESADRYANLLDIHGRTLLSAGVKTKYEKLDVRSLPAGIYILQVVDQKKLKTQRIVKE